ncbi:ribonuclease P protein component [Microvirga sp. W0021]|uniref:Ribonuclease P protein component n=1 Tax=Hohaiivirga grylli TaxID=3133970 RepID=A0ABV0BLB4_9HYPH
MSAENMCAIGRIKKRPDFVAAASGRRFHTERMSVQGRLRSPNEHTENPGLRFGLTVTKKVGHATERNRIKRRLRNAVAQAVSGHENIAIDMVIIGRRTILSAEYNVLVSDIASALRVVSKPKSVNHQRRDP